ncbi:GPI-anchored protein LLG1-like [Tripterygium wilfordii]|uniref:GPI-anchored protein LLG1-like n=1 Tax=Tripterygium wilfordii TaxID=458696 RepID=UPI0018F85224|nr:GPI-anchored protein LLG1-like [Tripterygium wilfordii]
MASNSLFYCLFCFFLLTGFAASSSYISNGAFEDDKHSGRSLLQAKKKCPVNFEGMNYTIVTSTCKGPQYPADKCCSGLKEFACPFADEVSDMTNDCASTMFSYINLYGKYPPGLFANLCKGDDKGLKCSDAETVQKNSVKSNNAHIAATLSKLLMLEAGFLALVFQLF